MSKEKNVYQKLSDARLRISSTKLKKEGRNTFSKYDYFTPSQVSHLVSDACQNNGLLTTYSINETDRGYLGELTVINISDPSDTIRFDMATAMPEIKATNESQKLGGMVTYNERYLKMSAFEIVDNNLDFDAQDNTVKKPQGFPKKELLTEKHSLFAPIKEAIKKKERTIEQIKEKFTISKEVELKLKSK